jgi:hypothetical protein
VKSIAYRLAVESDLPFIYGGWLASFRTSHGAGVVPMSMYGAVYTEAINQILRRPAADVVIAHWPGETVGDLVGFLCAEKAPHLPVVHYCYVDKASRKAGVARGLFKAAGIDPSKPFLFTFRTGVVSRLRDKIPSSHFDPLQARFDTTEERP